MNVPATLALVPTEWLIGGVLAALLAATGIGQWLKTKVEWGLNPALLRRFNLRIRALWLICSVLAVAFIPPPWLSVVLFGAISFWALREFITLTPTRPGDHRALFWVFFVIAPLQFLLVGLDRYDLYSILIPVFAFLFILIRIALAGDYKRFLERAAKIQAGLMITVYCFSFAPAMLYLKLTRVADSPAPIAVQHDNAAVLFFFALIAQLSDILIFAGGLLFGQRVVAPAISPSKTWEGLAAGAAAATLIGASIFWATPFEPWEAALLAAVIALLGFAGSLTMSAIKRDRGVQDYGTLIQGHGGVLDRIDSMCFAAPVFYLLVKNVIAG